MTVSTLSMLSRWFAMLAVVVGIAVGGLAAPASAQVQPLTVPGPGICCNFFTGSCAITLRAACGTAAHSWAAGGTCSPNPCDQPGACCDTSLVCRHITAMQCSGASATWTTGTCSPLPCTLNGRCCNYITGACTITLEGACGIAAHTWAFGGACSPNTCDQPGACCVAGTGICRHVTQAQCAGIWTNSACTPTLCPIPFVAKWASTATGARAIATFDLAHTPTLLNPGNNDSGFGTVLTNLHIKVYGATAGNGTWAQSDFSHMVFHWGTAVNVDAEWVGQSEGMGQWGVACGSDFNLFNQTYGAPNGTECNELSTNAGAGDAMELASFHPLRPAGGCCGSDGACTIATEPACVFGGGTAQASGSTCSPSPCTFAGRCCNIVSGSCVITALDACGLAGHSWAYAGSCTPNTCDLPGACCDLSLACRRLTLARCAGSDHAWTSGACSPLPCTLNGRCCNFVNGACSLTLQAACGTAAHTWALGGTCSPNTCGPTGACCIGGSCRKQTEAFCGAASGTWTSGGTCVPSPCVVLFAAAEHACAADFNRSGSVDVADIFDFLSAWLAADPRADFNGNGLSAQGIFDFLNAWLAGC